MKKVKREQKNKACIVCCINTGSKNRKDKEEKEM